MKNSLAENLRYLMQRKVFEKITIKQICDETGVIRATFYNYFEDKYDCLNWIVHNIFTDGFAHADILVLDLNRLLFQKLFDLGNGLVRIV